MYFHFSILDCLALKLIPKDVREFLEHLLFQEHSGSDVASAELAVGWSTGNGNCGDKIASWAHCCQPSNRSADARFSQMRALNFLICLSRYLASNSTVPKTGKDPPSATVMSASWLLFYLMLLASIIFLLMIVQVAPESGIALVVVK